MKKLTRQFYIDRLLLFVIMVALSVYLVVMLGIQIYRTPMRIRNYIQRVASESQLKKEKEEFERQRREENEKIMESQRLEQEKREQRKKEEDERNSFESQMKVYTQITKEKYPLYSYVHNTSTNEYGKINHIDGYMLYTDTGMVFEVEDENIEFASYKEYKNYRKKINDEIKKKEEEALVKESESLKPKQESVVKAMFPHNPKYYYIKINDGTYGKGTKYDGFYLVLNDGRRIWYKDATMVGYIEYSRWEDMKSGTK